MVRKMFETRDDVLPLVLRLTLGAVMIPHGAQKLLGWFGGPGLGATVSGFQEHLGMPALVGVLVVVAESFGALGLLAGLLTRLSALGIGAVMLGAVSMVHGRHGFFMNWSGAQAGEGIEYHLLVLGLAAALVIRGGGAWSLDRVASEWGRERQPALVEPAPILSRSGLIELGIARPAASAPRRLAA